MIRVEGTLARGDETGEGSVRGITGEGETQSEVKRTRSGTGSGMYAEWDEGGRGGGG